MATPTYTALATVTLASSASDITFSSIDTATYRDLILVAKAKSTSSTYDQAINFNGDTTAGNYSCVIAYGSGSTGGSTTSSFIIDFYGSVTTDNTNVTILQILDAGASDKHTTYLSRANRASSGVDMIAGRWANTAAITSLRYFLNGGTLDAGTVVSLWGIEA